MFNAGTVVAEMRMDATKFKKGITDAKTSLRSLKDEQAGLNNTMTKLSSGMQSTGKKMTMGLTLPIVGAGAASVKTAANFESAMSEVQAIAGITDKTSDEFKKLQKTALDLGATTAFSASESAEGMKYLAMAGMSTNEIVDAMPGLLDLAAASGTDLGTTSDIVSDALSAFNMEAKESGHLADIMALASSRANTNVEMLGESYKYAAPVAAAFGMSAEETTTALSMMANSGIKASQAGTTLRSALTNLAKPTKEAQEWLDKLNVETTDSQGNMLDFNDIMGQLRDGYGGLTEQQKLQATTTIFGKQAMSGMEAVLKTSTDEFDQFNTALENSGGTAGKMADTQLDNLKGRLELLKSSLETMAIVIGNALIPVIETVAKKIKEWTDWFNGLSEESQQMIIKIALVVAAIGPLLFIVGKVIAVVQTLIAIAPVIGGAFTLMTGPIGLVVAAIAAVIAIGVLLYKNWDEIKKYAGELWTTIKQTFSNIVESITQSFDNMVATIVGFGTSFKNAGSGAINFVWDGMKGVWGKISGWVGDKVSWLKDKLTFWKKSENKMNKSNVKSYDSSDSKFDAYKNRSSRGYASGTNNASPGWHWVGEEGPELRKFRGGESVLPSGLSQTVASMKGALATPQVSGQSSMMTKMVKALAQMSNKPSEFKLEVKEMIVRQESDVKAVANEVFKKVDAKLDQTNEILLNQIRREART